MLVWGHEEPQYKKVKRVLLLALKKRSPQATVGFLCCMSVGVMLGMPTQKV